jgi:hypothetical protein
VKTKFQLTDARLTSYRGGGDYDDQDYGHIQDIGSLGE